MQRSPLQRQAHRAEYRADGVSRRYVLSHDVLSARLRFLGCLGSSIPALPLAWAPPTIALASLYITPLDNGQVLPQLPYLCPSSAASCRKRASIACGRQRPGRGACLHANGEECAAAPLFSKSPCSQLILCQCFLRIRIISVIGRVILTSYVLCPTSVYLLA